VITATHASHFLGALSIASLWAGITAVVVAVITFIVRIGFRSEERSMNLKKESAQDVSARVARSVLGAEFHPPSLLPPDAPDVGPREVE
jgi:hypothetical protein